MDLTTAQLQTLKADIQGNANVATALAAGDMGAIANYYNQAASPQYVVWRTTMPVSEIREVIDWGETVALGTNALLAFQILTNADDINPSDQDIRDAFADIFSGPGGVNSRTALTTAAKRNATYAEKLFATGTGSDASPGTLTAEGTLTYQDVSLALYS